MTNGDAQERVVVMEVSQVELREQIIRLEGRMDVLDTKVDNIQDDVKELKERMDRLEGKMDKLTYFLIGFTVINVGAVAAGFWAVVAALSN